MMIAAANAMSLFDTSNITKRYILWAKAQETKAITHIIYTELFQLTSEMCLSSAAVTAKMGVSTHLLAK